MEVVVFSGALCFLSLSFFFRRLERDSLSFAFLRSIQVRTLSLFSVFLLCATSLDSISR